MKLAFRGKRNFELTDPVEGNRVLPSGAVFSLALNEITNDLPSYCEKRKVVGK